MKKVYEKYRENKENDSITFSELKEQCAKSKTALKNDDEIREFAEAHPLVSDLMKASIWQFHLPLAAAAYNNV